ncbi:MAG: tRNA (adenosine(37)-N6)-threonylcarbamoyltransferase complex dimerization subunit type 1 TsaB [Rhodocyclaceae bacterium]|nr:tRNA (adenosine(37)-N6)-threonylcarbamoyltransferase complex dimerization subunit type 1 TsaB [Rhodocyclaceae bacterium]
MRILAIETSSDHGSLALADHGDIDCVDLEAGPAQSTTALAKLRALLEGRQLSVRDIDAIAFGSGPGMFTGLRLGCGLAQGLAIGLVRPVVAVSSLEALAQQSTATHIVAATDARMGEVYSQCFVRTEDGLKACVEASCRPPESLALPDSPASWEGVGNAFEVYADRLPDAMRSRVEVLASHTRPHARDVLAIASRRLARGESSPLSDVVPHYVRNKVALTTRERLERGGRV